jgi:hypothetical protein
MGAFSIWHWLVTVLVLAPWATLAFFAIRGARSERGVMTPGFKGWLLVLVIGQWFAPLRILGELGQYDSKNSEVSRQFPVLPMIDYATILVGVLLTVSTIYLMMKKKKSFISFFKLQYIWGVASLPLGFLLGVVALSTVYGMAVNTSDLFEILASEIGKWIGLIIFGGIWLTYVLRSRRVRITFTR